MSLQSDITCQISKEKDGYRVTWKPDAPIKTEGMTLSYLLKGVKEITLQGKAKSSLEFTLFSSGRVSSLEMLTLISKEQEKAISLDLTYPASFIEGSFNPSYKSALQKSNTLPYPEKKS